MADLRKLLFNRGSNKRLMGRSTDCTPTKWTKYFENERDIIVKNNKFHIYTKGDKGPVVLPLHGGGYNALTWSLFVEEITRKIECQIVALDLRGHGNTETETDDLSLESMANDVVDVVNELFGEDPPVIILIGHSMGGAVAVEVASLLPTVKAVCVIDVVEGTALDALSSMQSILRGRPSSFKSIEEAILWSYKSGQTHNMEAARVSMPGQIKNKITGVLAANECDTAQASPAENKSIEDIMIQPPADAITEENEDDEEEKPTTTTEVTGKPPLPAAASTNGCKEFAYPHEMTSSYVWRIDLSKTEKYWTGWFKGLSQKFLDVHAPKVLLLANIQGLDTTLTIGQMQGKFQMQVLSRSGHAIHEDNPTQVADIIAGFLVKQKLADPKEDYIPTMPAC